ncbi:Avirulence (Avh) protein [Phytophthora megakarya]|uniref:Avirulence (Avh) protein n=1 Tax=Phytophthora megakarya TaxID=4795 RepID=A0A225WRH2_9STRA|nr:Avirulence (Avh) protein [Phytophthora megakarya]
MLLVALIRVQVLFGLKHIRISNPILPSISENNEADISTHGPTINFHESMDADKLNNGGASKEERLTVPGLSNILVFASTSKVTSAKERKIAKWLQKDTKPDVVFNKLKLGRGKEKLDDSPLFRRWVQYVQMYQTKKRDFSDYNMYMVLKQSNSEEKLVELFHSMRRYPEMKDLANTLQMKMYTWRPSSHKVMEEVWLKSRENPEEVFSILHVRNDLAESAKFIPWLRYTEMYRSKFGINSFSDFQILQFLSKSSSPEAKLGILMQQLKRFPEFEKLADNVQRMLFHKWIQIHKETPEVFGRLLASPYNSGLEIMRLPKTDARFKTLEGYTLQYVADVEGEVMMKAVKHLFDDDKPQAAFVFAMKAVNVR